MKSYLTATVGNRFTKTPIFFTLDRTVTEDKLEKISDRDLHLVVPEEDKKDIAHYRDTDYVLSFKDFFNNM